MLCLLPAGDQQQLLLDVDAAGVSSALQWLSRYKLRRKLDLQDFSGRVAVWAAFDGQLKAGPAGESRGVDGGLCAVRGGGGVMACTTDDQLIKLTALLMTFVAVVLSMENSQHYTVVSLQTGTHMLVI